MTGSRLLPVVLLFALCTGIIRGGASVSAGAGFDAKTAAFSLTFHGERSSYRDAFVAAMPGDNVIFEAAGRPGEYSLSTEHGSAVQQSEQRWQWTAPERPGTYELKFKGPGAARGHDEIAVHALVMVPAREVKDGMLNGYPIGAYPPMPAKPNPQYSPPAGFIEVTKDNEDTKVSPHFVLKQFVCKEDTTSAFPKYVVLKERLPLKLEAVLELVNTLGFDVDTLHVMSAYRTPYYNHAIGDVKYSMHQWGSAADVYVDRSKKDRMEDLNRDGRIDVEDAKFLYDRIEEMLAIKAFRELQGGMGFYPATPAHPPFVHVDVRGTAARWKG